MNHTSVHYKWYYPVDPFLSTMTGGPSIEDVDAHTNELTTLIHELTDLHLKESARCIEAEKKQNEALNTLITLAQESKNQFNALMDHFNTYIPPTTPAVTSIPPYSSVTTQSHVINPPEITEEIVNKASAIDSTTEAVDTVNFDFIIPLFFFEEEEEDFSVGVNVQPQQVNCGKLMQL